MVSELRALIGEVVSERVMAKLKLKVLQLLSW